MHFGAPWIFKNIIHYLENKESQEYIPTPKERFETINKHINLIVSQKGENVGIKEMRKHLAWYTKNLENSSQFRQKINCIETKSGLINELENYFKTL